VILFGLALIDGVAVEKAEDIKHSNKNDMPISIRMRRNDGSHNQRPHRGCKMETTTASILLASIN
jgi:hypothetical protein